MKKIILQIIISSFLISLIGCTAEQGNINKVSSKLDKNTSTTKTDIDTNTNPNIDTFIGTYKISSKNTEKDRAGDLKVIDESSQNIPLDGYSGYFTLNKTEKNDEIMFNYKMYYVDINEKSHNIISNDTKMKLNKNDIIVLDNKTLKINNLNIINQKNNNPEIIENKYKYNISIVKMYDKIGDINGTNRIEIDSTTDSWYYRLYEPGAGGPLCDKKCSNAEDSSCVPHTDSAGACSDINAMFKFIGIYKLQDINRGCTEKIVNDPSKFMGRIEATASLKSDVILTIKMNIDFKDKNLINKCQSLLNSPLNTAPKTDKEHRFYTERKHIIDITKYGNLTNIFPAVGLNSIQDNYTNVNYVLKKIDLSDDEIIGNSSFETNLKIYENIDLNANATLENTNLITNK